MKVKSFKKSPAYFEEEKISIEQIVPKQSITKLRENNLIFLYNLEPIILRNERQTVFVPERSVIKAPPSFDLTLQTKKQSSFYMIGFHQSEEEYLENLKSNPFLNSLTGKYKKEWGSVKNEPLDYIIPAERNSEHIIRLDGILIAPPHSRFNSNSSSGWNLMYARGSKTLGVGTDTLFELRSEEESHYHRIIKEFYIGIEGKLLLEIEKEDIVLSPKQAILTIPTEQHRMKSLAQTPYNGVTLQLPSIPGDRIIKA